MYQISPSNWIIIIFFFIFISMYFLKLLKELFFKKNSYKKMIKIYVK